jgi:transcriptional regulator with XRE-family HTH domain
VLVGSILREIEAARVDRALPYRAIAEKLSLSPSQLRRLLHGQTADPGLIRVAQVCALVGLELSARAYPVGDPIRDRPQHELLARFGRRVAAGCVIRFEVPVIEMATPGSVDLRAWDAAVDGRGWSLRVDAETRIGDIQALQRRIALKQRDSRVAVVILLAADTRHNRSAVRVARQALASQFPVSSRTALARLREGEPPPGNSLILI